MNYKTFVDSRFYLANKVVIMMVVNAPRPSQIFKMILG